MSRIFLPCPCGGRPEHLLQLSHRAGLLRSTVLFGGPRRWMLVCTVCGRQTERRGTHVAA